MLAMRKSVALLQSELLFQISAQIPATHPWTVVRFGKNEEEFVTQFHVFVVRGDLKALAEARKLAASIIKKGPIQSTTDNDGAAPRRV